MKHLRGHRRRYFSLSAIAMYSTLTALSWIDSNYQRHRLPHLYHEYKTSPPDELCS